MVGRSSTEVVVVSVTSRRTAVQTGYASFEVVAGQLDPSVVCPLSLVPSFCDAAPAVWKDVDCLPMARPKLQLTTWGNAVVVSPSFRCAGRW